MFEYYFTFRALTQAQSAQNVLHTNSVAARLERSPQRLSSQGCGYVLRVSARYGARALSVLRTSKSAYSHVYRVFETGMIEEVAR